MDSFLTFLKLLRSLQKFSNVLGASWKPPHFYESSNLKHPIFPKFSKKNFRATQSSSNFSVLSFEVPLTYYKISVKEYDKSSPYFSDANFSWVSVSSWKIPTNDRKFYDSSKYEFTNSLFFIYFKVCMQKFTKFPRSSLWFPKIRWPSWKHPRTSLKKSKILVRFVHSWGFSVHLDNLSNYSWVSRKFLNLFRCWLNFLNISFKTKLLQFFRIISEAFPWSTQKFLELLGSFWNVLYVLQTSLKFLRVSR